jgi:hypothetical protein
LLPAERAPALSAGDTLVDIVDASVVEGALRRADIVISSDRGDLEAIATAAGGSLSVEEP